MLNKDDRVYLKSNLLEESTKIIHCFTSKMGGASCGTIKGLNLGFRVGDDYEAVVENYRLVAKDFDFPYENITAAKQTHSTDIRIISKKEAGCGVSRSLDVFEADGLVTNVRGIPLVVFYADCVPILLADDKSGVIAAVHSGWKGTKGGIVAEAIKVMQKEFKVNPFDIKAAIGPSIGPCCFEVGCEVADEFDDDLSVSLENGKKKVDLWEANQRLLIKEGVLPQNIDVLEICTVCRNDMLYSYRMDKEKTGRMGAFIMLREE